MRLKHVSFPEKVDVFLKDTQVTEASGMMGYTRGSSPEAITVVSHYRQNLKAKPVAVHEVR